MCCRLFVNVWGFILLTRFELLCLLQVGYEVLMCDFHLPHMHRRDRVVRIILYRIVEAIWRFIDSIIDSSRRLLPLGPGSLDGADEFLILGV